MHHKVRAAIILFLAAFSLQGCGWVAIGLLSQSGGSSGGGGNQGALSLPPQVLTLQVTNTPNQSRPTDLSGILLNFSLIHPTAVPADVLVEFSTDGVNFNNCNITTIIADSQNLPDSNLTELPTSGTGVPFTMTWAADQGNLTALSQVSIRITASNSAGSSIPALVENIVVGNDAPIASALQINTGSPNDIGVLVVSEIVILEFELNDSTRDPTNIIFEFVDPSVIDDPMTPQNEQIKPIPAQDIVAGQSSNLLPDLPGEPAPLKFNLVWQSVATVGPIDLSGVRLRITPTDNLTNGQGVAVETAPFILLNNQPPVSTLQEPAFNDDDSGSLRLAFALGDPEEDGVDVVLQFSNDPNGFPVLEDLLNDPGQRRKILLDPDERRRRGIITPKVKTLFESRSTFATTGSGVNKISFTTNNSLIDPTTTLALTLPGEFRSISLLQALIGTKVQMLSNGGGVILERNVIGFDINTLSYILETPFPDAIPLGVLFRFRESIASLFLGRKSSQQGQVGEVAWDAAADLGVGQEGAGIFIKLTPFSNLQRGQSSQSNFPVQLNTSSFNLDEAGLLATDEEGTALATADVDLDGDLDLILAEFNPDLPGGSRILLYRNNGQSSGADSFLQNPTVLFPGPIPKDLKDIEAADLNGDGLPEIIFSDSATNLLIISGADIANPTPPAPFPLTLSSTGTDIIIKDIDGDKFVDIVVLTPADDAVTIFFGSANFFTGPAQVTVSTGAQGQGFVQHFGVADLNKDGKLDVVLEERESQVLVFLNDAATGRFSGVQANPAAFNAGGIRDFLILDVNSDLNPDLVYYDFNGPGRIAVSPGDGVGGFLTNKQPPSLNLDGKMLSSLDAADINNDGLLDLVISNQNGNNINVFPGLGNGEFRKSSADFIRIDTPTDLVIADFGSNGTLDIVVSTGETESIEFLANNSRTPFLIANQRLETDSAAARIGTTDINADGVPDVVILSKRLANGNQDEGIRLFVGAGNANYQPPFNFDLTDSPQDFAITDLGNDGTLDAVVIQDTSITIVPLSTTSTAANIITAASNLPAGMSSISLGDFNGDDIIDAVACNKSTGIIVVIPGTAASPFFGTPTPVFTQVTSGLSQVRFADMNGDGVVDIVAALPDSNEIKILFNNPASLGDFTTVTPLTFDFQALPGPDLFRLADFNSDGQTDILVSTFLTVALISSTGTGTFDPTPRSLGSNFSAPDGLSIGDIDKDGFKDIVVSDLTDYVILLGKGNGSFVPGAPFKIEATQPLDGRDVLLVELNGDGDLDFIAGQGNNSARIYLSDSRRPVNRFFDGLERANFPTVDIDNNPIDRDITPGTHTINTDAGTIDGEPIPSFNGKSFFFKNLNIQDNAIVHVVGRNPLNIRCMGSCTIAGTLDLSGAEGRDAFTFVAGAGGLGGPGAANGGDGAGFLRTDAGYFQAFPSIDGQTGLGLGRGFPGLRNGDTPGSGGGGAFSGVGGSNDGIPGIPYSNDMLTLLFGGSGGSGGSLRESSNPLGAPDISDLAGGGGGGGGGLLHIVAETIEISGTILTNGGHGGKGAESLQTIGFGGGHGGGGSGGAILIQGRQTIEFTGTGTIEVKAKGGPGEIAQGTGGTPASGGGKDGYIRLEDQDGQVIITGVTIDPQPTIGTFVDTASISIVANGVTGTAPPQGQ
ncbi:MAG: VCBS repeat-containing protein [Planctomycetota bacterium]|nr:VCBS repeat-containing protein [Planctomycetota bacterium]